MKATVLVTGAGALLGQGVIKSLRLADPAYRIVAVDPDPRGVGLYWADAAHLVPMATSPDYLDSLRRILERERPDAVLVGTDVELPKLARHREELEDSHGTRIIVSSPDVVRIADDKWLTYRFLESHGLPRPRSALPDGVAALIRECGFPLVVKPRTGARSEGVRRVDDEGQLQAALRVTENPIVQERVATSSDEYTSGILMTEGRVHAVVTMRRDLRDGNTYRAYVLPESPFDAYLAEVGHRLRAFGPVNFQFRVANGIAKIFEINARFSGTTPLRAYAGFNEVDRLLRHVLRGDPIPRPSLREMIILRYWDEVVVRPDQVAAISAGPEAPPPSCEHPTYPRLLGAADERAVGPPDDSPAPQRRPAF